MKTILFGLLIGLFITSYHFGKKALLMVYATRLDPIGLNYYPQTENSNQIDRAERTQPTIIFYGDSRALSWENPVSVEDQYHFINRAIGGQTSEQIVRRFQQHILPQQPDLIIVQMCINDLKMITVFPKQKREIIENCKKNLKEVVEEAEKIKTHTIVTTIFPLGKIPIMQTILGIKEKPIVDAIDEVNLFINSLANKNTTIFDTYQLLKGHTRRIDSAYSYDWLHLNREGYKLLNRELIARKLLEIHKATPEESRD